MAVLAVKIENEASLMMNEFFDYHGECWALTRQRNDRSAVCISLEDFYECTVRTEWIEDVPVVFIFEGKIIGWYRHARVYRHLQIISAFLEGNICARALHARLLAAGDRIVFDVPGLEEKMYQVIEEDDVLYDRLMAVIDDEQRHFIEIRYDMVTGFYSGDRVRMAGSGKDGSVKHMRDYCIEKCESIAEKMMNDRCSDIREPKTMYQYASQAVKLDGRSVDGLYYLAMACEQLGFVREGFKAIEKALKLEPDGDDLLALKGHLLFAEKKYEEAAGYYQEAYDIQPMDGYLLCVGQAWFAMGNVDKAYKAYQQVKDKKILSDCGINLKDMERRWPFVALRGFSIKDFFSKKHD